MYIYNILTNCFNGRVCFEKYSVLCFSDLGDDYKNFGVNFQERIKKFIFNKEPRKLQVPQNPLAQGVPRLFFGVKGQNLPFFSIK
jgi:hypothetical protein